MKVYWIDAAARTITEIEWTDKTFRTMFPGGPTIGLVFPNRDVLYVDDEGLLHPATVAFRLKHRADGQPMMSNGLLTGPDSISGNITLPPRMTIEALANEIEWLTVDEALLWFRLVAATPAVTLNGQPVATWAEFLGYLTAGR